MDPRSGTELQHALLERHADRALLDQVQITLSIPESIPLHPTKPNILWQHNAYSFPAVAEWFQNKANHAKYDWYVFNSHWSYEKFRRYFDVPTGRCHVIKNGTVGFPDRPPFSPGAPIRMLFHPTPWRGLDVLLGAMRRVTTPNLMLDVYSSTQIYGAAFQAQQDHIYAPLYELADSLPNCTYIGYQPHETIVERLPGYHLFAYPSIWEETFCVSALEAMAAGLYCITTDFGALYETCAEFPVYVTYQDDHAALARNFAHAIDSVCQVLPHAATNDHLRFQQHYVRRFYDWDLIGRRWNTFLARAVAAKRG